MELNDKNFKKEQERLSAIKQAEKVIADYESLKGAKNDRC